MATQWTAGTTSGQVLTAATLNTIGAAWVDYTPTLSQGATVSKTIVVARYCQIQKLVMVSLAMNPTSAGTAGNALVVGLPIAARAATAQIVGHGFIYDNSPQFTYNISAYLASTTTVASLYQGGSPWGNSPALTIANGDQVQMNFMYEVA